jgi:AAA+ superfamily predicted ATPase
VDIYVCDTNNRKKMKADKPLNSVLKDMSLVNKLSKKSKLSAKKLSGSNAAATRLAEYLGVNKLQAYLFAATFFINLKENRSDISDIGAYFGMEEEDTVCLIPEINELVEKKYLTFLRQRYHSEDSFLTRKIKVSEPLLKCIFDNKPVSEMEKEPEMDVFLFVKEVSELIEFRSNNMMPTMSLIASVKAMEKEHPELSLPADLIQRSLAIEDRIIFYEICDDMLVHGHTALVQTLEDIFENVKARLVKTREILNGSDPLSKLGLIKLEGAQMIEDATLDLTQMAKELFLGEYVGLFADELNEDLVKTEALAKKDLYFDAELRKQLQFLQTSLCNENYLKMQERLVNMKMPGGIAAILYGEPGTGKTESVYQIARETGREIFHVNISNTKSMWFGESEKKIKEVFTKYERLCKRATIKPILLFNEADAIFGRRKEVGSSNVAQTENAIQNIILEEMEKLEGILIATTNLATNLDPAFERRFLFKIRFRKPSLEVNEKIWKSKLEWLDEAETRLLAARFAFSGGEIENVARKVAMDEVLTGERPGLDKISGYCEVEKLGARGQRRRIGFAMEMVE